MSNDDESSHFSNRIRKNNNLIIASDDSDDENLTNDVKRKKCDSNGDFEVVVNDELQRHNFCELNIKPVQKKSNAGDVWKYFGFVCKNDRILPTFDKKIVCKQCFEKRIWKWYVNFCLKTIQLLYIFSINLTVMSSFVIFNTFSHLAIR